LEINQGLMRHVSASVQTAITLIKTQNAFNFVFQSRFMMSSVNVAFFGGNSHPTQRARTSSFTRFLDHTQRRTTIGRTPLDEWSARRRDFYLTTHNNHNRETSMSPVGFEPKISACERPQTYASDRAATGTGKSRIFFLWRCDPTRFMASSFLRFLDHAQRRTTVGRTPLDEWWAHRRDFYLATHNTHNRQTSMSPVGFEPKISACERPQT